MKKPKKQCREAGMSVSDCNFVGVQYDAKAVDAIQIIAQGLVENAKALGALADVLKASNVTIDTMLHVSPGTVSVGGLLNVK